jgi:hypothetical protein
MPLLRLYQLLRVLLSSATEGDCVCLCTPVSFVGAFVVTVAQRLVVALRVVKRGA